MQPTKACGVIVFRDHPVRSFLLMVHPLRWDLPKGHLDAAESELQCALRELHEETGIQADDIEIDPDFRFVTQYPVRYKKKHDGELCEKTLVILLGWLQHPVTIHTSEHESHQWITWTPPHKIQRETIDLLLEEVDWHLAVVSRHPR